MSFGALSSHAVMALNGGAKIGNFAASIKTIALATSR
jgi:hypothetical protein